MKASLSHKYIKTSRMLSLMERRDGSGAPVTFSISFVRRSDGGTDRWEGCRLTSRHSAGGTLNIMKAGDNFPRKVRICLILTFNNLQVYF